MPHYALILLQAVPPAVAKVAKAILMVNLLRYFLVAGLAFLLFYVLFRRRWAYAKLQAKFPKLEQYIREVGYSLCTTVIFMGIGVLVFAGPLRHYHLRYDDVGEWGWGYWGLSVVLMILLHDTYFYWAHRLMHHPRLFKYFHLVHHRSTNPSPWAAYAFHPLEGVVEAAVVFPIVLLIPFHLSALAVFLLFMMVYNVYGHLGYELFPAHFHRHPIGRWLNTSVNHNQHHQHFHGNYGLYFLFWDRWMGTLRKDYDRAYEQADAKRTGHLQRHTP